MRHVVKIQRLSSSANNSSVGSSKDRESEEPVSTTSLTDSSTTASVIAAQTVLCQPLLVRQLNQQERLPELIGNQLGKKGILLILIEARKR